LATVDDFLTLDLRVGTIVAARPLRGARRPALALTLDFGALGTLPSSARIADLYEPDELVGLQVIAVVNLPPRRVAGLDSKVLVLAVGDGKGGNVLLIPERPVPDGGRVA
jgi:tRNA-binding protein